MKCVIHTVSGATEGFGSTQTLENLTLDEAFERLRPGMSLLVVVNRIENGSMPLSRRKFIQKVMSQLPGVPEPLILVRLNERPPGVTPEQDAETAAQYHQKPVAIASMDGQLLAYHVPAQR
jgi:hypothetical protein